MVMDALLRAVQEPVPDDFLLIWMVAVLLTVPSTLMSPTSVKTVAAPPLKVQVEPKTSMGLPLLVQVGRICPVDVWVMFPFQVAVPLLAFK